MAGPHTSKISRLLHAIDDWTSRAWTATALSAVSVVALVAALATGPSSPAVTVVVAVVQVATLIFVLVVQHTQTRDQRVTQRKLDELIAAMPSTDQRVIMLEKAPDDEINEAARRQAERRAGE